MSSVKGPNFILLFPDQWRGDCLGYLNHPDVETPFLDQLAGEGTVFTSAYSACPSCIAARASLATGQTPSSCGRIGYRDGVPWNYEKTFMKCLRDEGYQTLCAGKTHFHPPRACLGFEEIRLYHRGNYDPGFVDDYGPWLERMTGGNIDHPSAEIGSNSWIACPWEHPEKFHPSTWTADTALELLKRRDPTRPFFIQVGFHRPHPPLDPPVRFYENYVRKPLKKPVPIGDWAAEYDHPVTDVAAHSGRLPEHLLERMRKAYFAQLTHLDYQIGRILFWLKDKKIFEETCVIFTSDHGELLGDHNLFRKIKPFEGSAKIPFIFRAPSGAGYQSGKVCDKPIALMDVMPTVFEECGIPVPSTVEGASLRPLLSGSDSKWRDFIHGEHSEGNKGWQFVTDGKEKFIWESSSGRELFFDLRNDPDETTDFSNNPRYADRVELWRKRLISVLSLRPSDGLCSGDSLIPGKVLPAVRPEILG